MKQRVLIVNKFYYPRGGDCVSSLNLERLLTDKGHDVAVYSMRYPDNIPSDWSDYFASTVDFGGGAMAKLKATGRALGFGDIHASFARIIADFKPNVVHLQNIHSYLSPQLAVMARKFGAKVLWTLHDYKLICPSYSCLRDGKPCEECFTNPNAVLRYRCMKGSLAASVVAWAEARRWNRRKLEKVVDTFICPSEFMKSKMAQAGFDSRKLLVNCNFIGFDKMATFASLVPLDAKGRGDFYCYVGRLSKEKGVESLLEAASGLKYKLVVVGDGPLIDELRSKYECSHIEFLGRRKGEEVVDLLRHARFSIMPSICYDNNPLGVIESLCAGTPVVGACIGGIPELIDQGKTGLVFKSGNIESMRAAIRDAFNADWDYTAIRDNSIERFSPERHYKTLLEAYNK